MKWRRGLPKYDGTYIITTRFGHVTDYKYTVAGGWNTHYVDGELKDKCRIEDSYVIGWMPYPKPMQNPDTAEFDVEWGCDDE